MLTWDAAQGSTAAKWSHHSEPETRQPTQQREGGQPDGYPPSSLEEHER
jgi:hypothetical protein